MTPKRKRREEQLKLYREVTRPAVIERAGGRCEELDEKGNRCLRAGTECHHVIRRSGHWLNEEKQIILLCNQGHVYAQGHLDETRPKHLKVLQGYGYNYPEQEYKQYLE